MLDRSGLVKPGVIRKTGVNRVPLVAVSTSVVRLLRNTLTSVLSTAAVITAAGCGAAAPAEDPRPRPTSEAPPTSGSTAAPGAGQSQRLTVDQMAASVGCVPEPMVKAADFRQVRCDAPDGKLVLLDFDTAEGQRAWLETAQLYGGVYLVGDRWLLSADTVEYMETLRGQFGGSIER
jgi:hypothetical protein